MRLVAIAAAAAIAGACASTGAPRAREPVIAKPASGRTGPAGARIDRHALIKTALRLRGTPYRNRGSDPRGFDCSGFIQYVFGRYGVPLPREARQQFEIGRPVKRKKIAPGDLVFFTTIAPGASHVGLALDGDRFVHAPASNGAVRVEQMSAAYWARRFVGARRLD